MSKNDNLLVTPPRHGIKVPTGRILIHNKWYGNSLALQLIRTAGASYCDGMGIVDFYLSDQCPVVYVTELDLLCNTFYKNKLAKLKADCIGRGLVVAVMNDKTRDNFCELQDYAALELDLDVLAIGDVTELPLALQIQATVEMKSPHNPSKKNAQQSIDAYQISMLLLIPGVGRKKAEQLLQVLGHIAGINNASRTRLISIVGEVAGHNIYNYLHESH